MENGADDGVGMLALLTLRIVFRSIAFACDSVVGQAASHLYFSRRLGNLGKEASDGVAVELSEDIFPGNESCL